MLQAEYFIALGIVVIGVLPLLLEHLRRRALLKRLVQQPVTRWRWPQQHELLLLAAFAAGVFLGAWMGLAWWLTPVLGLAGSIGVRKVWQQRQKKRARELFAADFPEAVDALTRAVQAGVPVERALATLTELFPGELGERFAHLSSQLELGVPLRDALQTLSAGLDLPDVDFFCAALALNRDSGGQLSGMLQSLSRTLRERRGAQRKLLALTAESRAAARIVGTMPLVIIGLQALTNPAQLQFLWRDDSGRMVAAYALVSIVSGLLVIRRMSRF